MTFQATAFRVMIASPGDVAPERQAITDVVADWNVVHASDKEAVLLPVAWESHAAPEMGARPQDIINRRLLEHCDLLIAVFWTKVGTPTGVAASGTIEEIEEHLAKDKPAMIYFSDAPVRMDSVDATQYEALKTFKESCRTRGLYQSYDSLGDFRDKVGRQLAQTMIRLCAGRPKDTGVVVADDFVLGTSRGRGPALTNSARELLKAAAGADGTIMRIRVMGGTIVQAAGRLFNIQGDARDTAKWEAAIESLAEAGLVETSGRGEIYRVTHAGYGEADRS